MHKTLLSVLFLLLSMTLATYGQTTKIMTYNIRYDNPSDSLDLWDLRKGVMADQLRKHRPGIIGMQEVLFNQLNYLDENLPNYAYIGVGREDGKTKGEFSPIFYNKKRYKLLQSSTFWLSKSPTKVSIGWDAALERICTYGLFEDLENGLKFWVFNTHFDHKGVQAREKSAKLILKRIKFINTDRFPVVLMGDLNLAPEEKPIELIKKKMKESKEISMGAFKGPKGTFNGFDLHAPMDKKIDYIFVKGLKVESCEHLAERTENGRHISDHLPVLISVAKD